MAIENIDEVVALIRGDVVTIGCAFENGDKEYTFLATREILADAGIGDLAIVRTTNGDKLARITKVDDTLDTSKLFRGTKYRYLLGVVKADTVNQLEAENEAIASEVHKKQAERMKASALELLGIDTTAIQDIRTVALGGGQNVSK